MVPVLSKPVTMNKLAKIIQSQVSSLPPPIAFIKDKRVKECEA
jgi:hypothetical protein